MNDFFWGDREMCEGRLLASSCLSVCPDATTRFPLDGFSWSFIYEYFFFEYM